MNNMNRVTPKGGSTANLSKRLAATRNKMDRIIEFESHVLDREDENWLYSIADLLTKMSNKYGQRT